MIILLVVALLAVGLVTEGVADPKPGHMNAKITLPEQANARAQANRAGKVDLAPIPVAVPVPPPPPVIPPIVAQILNGNQASGNESQTGKAVDAIATATQTVRTRLAAATSISVITMTGTRTFRQVTRLRPAGRAGDLEILRFRLTDRFGRKIGTGSMLCRWALVTRRLCWGEAILPRGKLIALGSSQTRVLGEFAVVGGTGVYLFKQGMMTWRALSFNKFAIRVVLA